MGATYADMVALARESPRLWEAAVSTVTDAWRSCASASPDRDTRRSHCEETKLILTRSRMRLQQTPDLR